MSARGPDEIVGLLLNVQCQCLPYEFRSSDATTALLTSDIPFPDVELQFEIGLEAVMELTERERSNCLALVARAPAFDGSDQASRLSQEFFARIVQAMRIMMARWVGMPIGWTRTTTLRTRPTSFSDGTLRELPTTEYRVWKHEWETAERYVWDDETPCIFGRDDLATVAQVMDQIDRLDELDEDEERRLRLAIGRLNTAFDRTRPEDQIVDLTIALEALYSTADERIKQQVATRASRYLEEQSKRQQSVNDNLRDWYKVRCNIVHGSAVDSNSSIEVAKRLRHQVQRSIRKALGDPQSLTKIRNAI